MSASQKLGGMHPFNRPQKGNIDSLTNPNALNEARIRRPNTVSVVMPTDALWTLSLDYLVWNFLPS